MSLYGALNIGVAGLSANSAALSAPPRPTSPTSTPSATRTRRPTSRPFSTPRAWPAIPRPASAPVIGQDVTTQGLPTSTSSPTDLSISGNGFFVVRHQCQRHRRARNIPAPAASRPTQNGNLKNAAGLYLLGYKLDAAGQCADQHQRAQPDQRLEPVGQGPGHRPAWASRPICSPAPTVDADLCRRRHDRGHGDAGLPAHHQCL